MQMAFLVDYKQEAGSLAVVVGASDKTVVVASEHLWVVEKPVVALVELGRLDTYSCLDMQNQVHRLRQCSIQQAFALPP